MTQQHNLSALKGLFAKAVSAAGFSADVATIHLEATKTLEHGHFASNVAMLLAGQLGKNPREVAALIAEHLKHEWITKVEIAGPGFINVWIDQIFYTEECLSLSQNIDDYLEKSLGFKRHGKTIVIEYSSPNIAKPLGVHNMLSTIIGDALKRIFKAYGYKVIAENYPGDIGTQFGKLIYAIKTWGDEKKIEQSPIDELLALYVHFHNEAEKDPTLEDRGREEYKKFEEGDKESRKMWKKIVDWSFAELQPIYDRLGVTFDAVHGESFFEDKMQPILAEGREKGIFVDGKDGAWVVMPENPDEPPALVKKSDGTTLYLTRDLAQMVFFEKEYHPDVMAWPVDVAQSLHFKQRFEVARKLGLTKAELVHVVFGRMEFKGEGLSTRKGNIIRVTQLLDEAESRALALAQERAAEDLSLQEQKTLARQMGIGSIKYNVLSQNRISNISFEWDKMLSFDGNSAPYLMYTAARARSVLQKGDAFDVSGFSLSGMNDLETQVMLDLFMFPGVLARSADEFKPNHIATYLYKLAQNFNTLYNAHSILQAENEGSKKTRLLLTASTFKVMEYGLALLGIEVPERM